MPELPEVETVVRSLRPHLVGARISEVTTSGLPLRLGRPVDLRALRKFSRATEVVAIRRRAKYVLVDLRGASGATSGLLVHLGMSGRLRLFAADAPRAPHTHVVWHLDGARELRYSDPRRFGLVKAAAAPDGLPELANLGPDPLDALDVATLAAALGGSRAPLKSFLLDQTQIAGLGNIYVCEAMFYARLHPGRPARRARTAAPALHAAIRMALTTALDNRGTTLRDFVDGDGGKGTNQDMLAVYGRAGEPCRQCAQPIRRRVDAGRSTFFCARCQK